MRFSWVAALGFSFALAVPIACGGRNLSVGDTTASSIGCKYQVRAHATNSWLLTDPQVMIDFWGDWSSNESSVMQSTMLHDWYYLLNRDKVLSRLSEYGIHEGSFAFVLYQDNPNPVVSYTTTTDAGITTDDADNDAGPNIITTQVLDDGKFPTQLQAEIQLGLIPYPNDNTLYVVMLPPNTTTVSMVKNSWSGYHDNSSYGAQRFAYAIVSYGTEAGIDVIASHEIYESCTDPGDGSGYWDDGTSSEIADLCEGNDVNINGYTVQSVWSQDICECQ